MVGDAYRCQVTASGGSGGYVWALAHRTALPAGLALDTAAGIISGIPLPIAQGRNSVVLQVTDSSGTTVTRTFLLVVNPALHVSPEVQRLGSDRIRLQATGGKPPYHWHTVADSTLPHGLSLDTDDGTITIGPDAELPEPAKVTIRVTDDANHMCDTRITLRARRVGLVRRRNRLDLMSLTARTLASFRWVRSPGFLVGIVALWIPLAGLVPIIFYAFTAAGQHGRYMAIGLITAIAAMVTGCLIGFLFGLPRLAPTQSRQVTGYLPSTNLPEVSDWLTKLLLGAGLVQLTHLGRPVAGLIDNVASGLDTTNLGSAKVMAGMIVFGYTGIGLLAGYVVTAIWYFRKLNGLRLWRPQVTCTAK
jgi:hypothetical protein